MATDANIIARRTQWLWKLYKHSNKTVNNVFNIEEYGGNRMMSILNVAVS